jgi:hypothetical protein
MRQKLSKALKTLKPQSAKATTTTSRRDVPPVDASTPDASAQLTRSVRPICMLRTVVHLFCVEEIHWTALHNNGFSFCKQ